ncbi:DUF302 domain-containing protein [Thermomicrobium sp. CFH 73360]|uniref:DUF302 domain-containing protein n=1 Tax=Thermomicrobium sp. CFH 73360 TaxID=2951987 RepID=UPI00207774DB|nr:DUF302 domain-containing protein [Thermomicrobium sp. CFH 73360]MCM8747046.1 DUF302 domain-containing protein [Thermomicrobium sp. CFH 73360]MCM8747337.1 DUF302 domain-containing protein [Thermomicrobium sp. CFH 73360]
MFTGRYGFGVDLEKPFDEVLTKVQEVLKSEGFGVLTTIDVKETLRQKLGLDMERYVILGACNPPLAHRALETEREVGLLLPCNVVVREVDGKTRVEIADPKAMLGIVGNPALDELAAEARTRLQRALQTLEAS